MVKALIARAKDGDAPAARLVLAYLVGPPGPAPDPDSLDEHEANVVDRRASAHRSMRFAGEGSRRSE